MLFGPPSLRPILPLTATYQNLEEFLEQMEEEKGVVGYRQTHADLMMKSEQTAQVWLG